MNYTVTIDQFEGPLDLLLHLLKQSSLNICEISLHAITEQYVNYLHAMEELNLDIASEYLTIAAELIYMKSETLLPSRKQEIEESSIEEPQLNLVERLREYQKYKEATQIWKQLEESRRELYTKLPSDLTPFKQEEVSIEENEVTWQDFLNALNAFMKRKQEEAPLETKITQKEYSVKKRCAEIRERIQKQTKVTLEELFTECTKPYLIVTFLSILSLARNQEIEICQENNFDSIVLWKKGCE